MKKSEFFRSLEGLSAGALSEVAWRHYKRLEALEGQLKHIRLWASGEMVLLHGKQVAEAVVRMCDDVLEEKSDG